MPQVVVLGEALFDLFAEAGVALHAAKTLQPRPGGAPANVAVGLARLGVDAGFIGKVGADAYGHHLIELLAEDGVDTAHFTADDRAPTMLAIVAAPSPTEQQFILYDGANALLTPSDIERKYVADAPVYIYGSITLSTAARAAATQAAIWARDAGKHVLFDVNLRPALWPDLATARTQIDAAIAAATIVKLNQDELEFVTGARDPAAGGRHLIERGVQLCCVSLGADGAFFANGAAQGHVPAPSVAVRDTTGSGDAFVAGLAMQINQTQGDLAALGHAELQPMLAFANACGALAATRLGAMSALPDRVAVERLVAARA